AGALVADVARRRSTGDRALLRSLLQWMAMIALLSVVIPNVSLWGHVGGVVGGLLWGFARLGLPADRRVDRLAGGLALAAVAWALVEVGRLVAQLL
ncbi:MAG: rhomboid family intramembrane serine protease, partial [Trueperaceae bacterium]|nr:rhomboid family intramembrane serine protease [Trueperaceae bacterium]